MCRALAVVLFLVASASPVRAEVVHPPACDTPSKRAVRTLADVDWCNFDFGYRRKLTRGRTSLHLYARRGQAHDTIALALRGVIYDRARHTAAVVLEQVMITNAGRSTSASTSVHVYKLARGKPVHAGSLDVEAPVHAITFEKRGVIAVTAGEPRTVARFARVGDDYAELAATP